MKSKRLKAVKSRTDSDKDTFSMSKGRFKGATIENFVRNSSRAKGTRDFASNGDSKHSREAIFDQDDSPATTKKDPPRVNKKRCASIGMKESPSKKVKLECGNKEGNQKRNARKNSKFNKEENEDVIGRNSSSKEHEAIKGKRITKRKSPVKSQIKAENRSSSRNKKSKETEMSSPPDSTPSPAQKVKTVGKKLELDGLEDSTAQNKSSSPEQEAMIVDKGTFSDESSDSEGVAWEDVDEADVDHHIVGDNKEGQLASTSKDGKSPSKKSVEISIALPGARRKGWSQDDVMKCIKRAVNRYKKEVNISIHKVHLLSLLGHGFFRNRVCSDPLLQAVVLSRVPSNFVKSNKRKWDVAELTVFLKWFQSEFPSKEGIKTSDEEIEKQISKVQNLSEIFVIVLRALGFLTRLVYSMQPISGKGNRDQQRRSPKSAKKRSFNGADRNSVAVKNNGKLKGATKSVQGKKQKGMPDEKTLKSEVDVKEEKRESCGPQVKGKKKMLSGGKTKEDKSDGVNSKPKVNILKRRPKRKQRKVNYSLSGSDDEGDSEEEWNQQSTDSEEESERNNCSGSKKNNKTPLSRNKRASSSDDSSGKLGNGSSNLSFVELVDSDSDFEATSKPVTKRNVDQGGSGGRKSVALLSDDSDESVQWQGTEMGKKDSFVWGADWWSEVYLPSDKKWICVHMESSSVNHPELCEELATQPLVYLVSFDNKSAVKDVTNRYASSWMSKTRKLRLDADWWEETLFPYRTKNKKMDQMEDSLLEGQMLDKPLPTTINEFKNHALYVLKRHLLKFEGLYPETAAILGYCRGEAVYSRDCVHLLHTREKWLNEALVVKQGEKAYKVVKGRPKRNQPVHERDSVTIDLFGRWQTEDYRPPPAKDGKVPRNEYGNVELFKECMLPPGTKHIKISGIQRVAKKLGIDCAQAVVGFDFHCGFSHPVIDGVVVCEEFENVLLDAWREEEEEADRKRAEKQEKRVLGNWKLLTRSLLIRERLKKRYNTQETQMDDKITNEEGSDAVASASVSWPLNIQEGRGTLASDGHCHVFLESDYTQDSVTGEWRKSCSCGLTLPFEKL